MPTTLKYLDGTAEAALAGTNLANNTNELEGSALTPTSAGYEHCRAWMTCSFATAPDEGGTLKVWFLETNGTNYEDGGASVTPTRAPDLVFALRPVTGTQVLKQVGRMPVGSFKRLVRNDSTSQTCSSYSLLMTPFTDQGV